MDGTKEGRKKRAAQSALMRCDRQIFDDHISQSANRQTKLTLIVMIGLIVLPVLYTLRAFEMLLVPHFFAQFAFLLLNFTYSFSLSARIFNSMNFEIHVNVNNRTHMYRENDKIE